MRLVRRLIELALVVFVISVFMKNKNIELQIDYYGLKEPIKLAFWELVTFCVSLGIIIAAVGDFITQLKWIGERRRMIKRDKEHQGEVDRLNAKLLDLQENNVKLKKELDEQSRELSSQRIPSHSSGSLLPGATPERTQPTTEKLSG
ncbi:hypothetical protein [Desulfomonile tiedjei]|uniref:Lipopolysaccharide assembly protein A domain-containing protein n=1 Tax=Desulfomonile tiedjei (strain ATCC 49306 / DSM 6799 / DCB-1) TaxID=706587 RepID=I4CAR3_DESTA|nr:hypothetical protein [Desulfomonile tiedjei]AFM26654.1 hypothetical protein Desti_4014 [Desulfomonile tiedjei DSM 6799]